MVSVSCLQQLRIYTEDLAGRGPVLGAGRMRGRGVIADLGLEGARLDDEKLLSLFVDIFGLNGTKLGLVTGVSSDEAGGYVVQLVEGACTYHMQTTEPMCVYTLGVFMGALQALTGGVMQGTETTCEAKGDPMCTYVISPHRALG
ncbi:MULTISPECIES: 4-vinyl reductase [unclassified Frankia]|uniref:4-vinyl reductase n=1 Tax=unclassified Frankia TaxID=2632575 RepID=UPI001EE4A41A|nr:MULTISPECIES: 4-vinyl reductase [unclassified Frankia]